MITLSLKAREDWKDIFTKWLLDGDKGDISDEEDDDDEDTEGRAGCTWQ
jgi:hypothetical protein